MEFDSGRIHDDASLKCYMYCLFKESGMIDDKGEIYLGKLIDHVDQNFDSETKSIAYKMGKRCLGTRGDNMCEKAFYYHRCWKNADPVVSSYL